MPSKGEKTKEGIYACTECGQKVMVENHEDPLPACPNCGNTEYKKLDVYPSPELY